MFSRLNGNKYPGSGIGLAFCKAGSTTVGLVLPEPTLPGSDVPAMASELAVKVSAATRTKRTNVLMLFLYLR